MLTMAKNYSRTVVSRHTSSEASSPIEYRGLHATGTEMIAEMYAYDDTKGHMQDGAPTHTSRQATNPMKYRGRNARCLLDAGGTATPLYPAGVSDGILMA
jgi:hypothetical protein